MSNYKEGTEVKWNWGNGEGKGVIKERFEEDATKTIKGTEVTRTHRPQILHTLLNKTMAIRS